MRRGEAIQLRWSDINFETSTFCLGDTKSGESIRPIPAAALKLLKSIEHISDYVFAIAPNGAPYGAIPRLWRTLRSKISEASADDFDEITLHSLRHSFAGIAEELGATIPTIAALLGHRLGGVTAGYILKRVDKPLLEAADRIGWEIHERMFDLSSSNVVAFSRK